MVRKRGKDRPPPERKKYSLQLTRKGVALWICLIFFISSWMFALGILVGRGTAPIEFDIKKLQKELAALKNERLIKELRRFKIDRDILENKPGLPFHEELKANTEDFSLPAEPVKDKNAPVPKKAVPKPPKQDNAKTAVKVKTPAEKPADQVRKRLTVQVASVKNQKDAEKMVSKLKNKGFSAYRTIAKIPGRGIWFRVRVGPLYSKAEADKMLIRLRKEKFKAIILNDG